ncbi:hypothetical protein ABPG72_015681 [Tetrahymena utriculariae]
MKIEKKQGFINDLFSSILEIIEDKPLYTIPIGVYCILIQIYHHQNAGYFMSNYELKPMTDPKMGFIAHLNEIAPGTFLCYYKANDIITIFVYCMLNFILYFYFSYILILTWLKRHHREKIEQNKKLFTSINRVLNTFFTVFWWIFFIPFIEINSGVMVTGGNSFLTTSRTGLGNDTNYADKPKIIMVQSTIGLILTILTAVIVLFFFRNYEFHETNLLKRRSSVVLFILVISRFSLTFFYYLNFPIVAVIKQYIAQSIGILGIYDFIVYLPFKNKSIAYYYGVTYCFFYVMVWITNLWQLSDLMPPQEQFYLFFIVGCVSGAMIINVYNYQTDILKRIENDNFEKYYKKYDYYLEELMRLTINSTKEESEKFQVLQIIHNHRQKCNDPECVCQEKSIVDFKNDINVDVIITYIIQRFTWALSNQIVQKDTAEFEHLSLKYISFLTKYKNNSPKAYNELKTLQSKRKNISIYFRTLSNILSKNIEFIMNQKYVRVQSEMNQKMKINEELQIKDLIQVEEFKNKLLNSIQEYCQHKINFWQKLRGGFSNFEQLKQYTQPISQFGIKLTSKFKSELSKLSGTQIRNNTLYYKIKSLMSVIVVNEINIAYKDQSYIKDLLKRDDANRSDTLSNTNLLFGNIDYIIISISKDRGKMLQKQTEKLARFFDYNLQDFQLIKYIKLLMPSFIGNIHNILVENMLIRGYSSCVSSVINSFGLSKFGFIFPLNIYINHLYENREDFQMHGTLLKINTPDQYILFDNSGNILGITFQLFMKMFDEDSCSDDYKYDLLNMDSMKKTQIQQKVKQFQERVNIQFILPQISKLVSTYANQLDDNNKQIRMKSQIMVNSYHIRLKIPQNLFEIVQMYKRKQTNISRSLRSVKSSVNTQIQDPPSAKVDLLKGENVSLYNEFIQDNKEYYLGDNCQNDFDLKTQLQYIQLIHGENFQESTQYFQLQISEINRIKQRSQTLHMNTLFPKSQFASVQYNSNSIPHWVNNDEKGGNIASPNNENLLSTSQHGFPMSLFNKINNNQSAFQEEQLIQSNGDLLQSASFNIGHFKNQQVDLDRTNNADHSNLVMCESESKRDYQYIQFMKQDDHLIESTNRNEQEDYQASATGRANRAKNQGFQFSSISESERPFQQKPIKDQYLNPKNQNGITSEIEIASPTQNSERELPSQNHIISRNELNNISQGLIQQANQFDLKNMKEHYEQNNVKERKNTLEHVQDIENLQKQQHYFDKQQHAQVAIEKQTTIWERKEDVDKDENVKKQQNDMQKDDELDEIFDSNQQKMEQKKEESDKQKISLRSATESNVQEYRYQPQRVNTNSKQSTKSKIKTKDENKNSVASSIQSTRFDNDIIKDMINTKMMPTAYQKFVLLSFLFPLVLLIMSFIYIITMVQNYENTTSDMENISNYQYLSTNYARSSLDQMVFLLMQNKQFTPSSFTDQYLAYYTQDLSDSNQLFYKYLQNYYNQIQVLNEEAIIGDDSKYKVSISQLDKTYQVQLSYPQFIDYSNNFINQFINNSSIAKAQINSFQFLSDNFALNINLHKQLIDKQYGLLDSHLETIETLYITIFLIQLVTTLSFLVLQIPQIIELHRYQEKVFMLVTRIYDLETLKEINKLNTFLEILQHPQQIWMKTDFAKLSTKEIYLNTNIKKSGKQIVLSSQIFDQKVKYLSSLTQILILFFLAQIYFGASIIYISLQQNNIKNSLAVNKICQQTNLAMNSFVFSSEILVFEGVIRTQFPDYNQLDRQGFLTLQKNGEQQMSIFTSNLQSTLSKFDVFDSQTLKNVNSLVKQDVCQVLTCQQSQNSSYTNGIVGIIQQQINLVSSFNGITQNPITPTDNDQILKFLLLQEQINNLLQVFNIPLQAMEQLIQYFTDGNKNTIDNLIIFIEVYVIVIGLFIVIVSVYSTFRIMRKLKNQTQEINFLLTFIPHQKMTEEATLHMLKSLSNCY